MSDIALEDNVKRTVVIYHPNQSVTDIMEAVLEGDYDVNTLNVNGAIPNSEIARDIVKHQPDLVYLALNFGERINGDTTSYTEWEPLGSGKLAPRGILVLQEVRDKDIPIILLSSGTTMDGDKARKYGASDHLKLPFDIGDLKDLTEKYANRQTD